MSFQHFRLGELALQQPLPPHLANAQAAPTAGGTTSETQPAPHFPPQIDNTHNSFVNNPHQGHTSNSHSSTSKQPYGSGDTDDGYTLIFSNLEEFHAWRAAEEERQMVEFVKGDTHGSKAVPPRFKDHTKLVCARHSRSGRKKYVKKHPERVRKVPSRKLDGTGCPASISFKTYFDTDEVRACYISQHSHEIGPANLPFTRRGRRAAVQQEKDKSRKHGRGSEGEGDSTTPGPASSTSANAVTGPSAIPPNPNPFASAVTMLAPLPGQPHFQPQPYGFHPSPSQSYPPTFPPPPPAVHPSFSHDRWENMATLFSSIREHARGFEYPPVSVAALETILIRLYLESPVGLGGQPSVGGIIQNGLGHPVPQNVPPRPPAVQRNPVSAGINSSANEHGAERNGAGGSEEESS